MPIRPNHANAIRITVLATLLPVLAACGSGSNSGRAATAANLAAFVSTVERVCVQAVAAHGAQSFPLASFDPQHPNPDQLPIVGNYFATVGQLPHAVAALDALTPPPADAARWRGLLSLATQMRDNSQRQIEAARAKDVSTFVATVNTAHRLTDQLDADGRSFGFATSSPCGQVFG